MNNAPFLELIIYHVTSEINLIPLEDEHTCITIANQLVTMDPWRTLGSEPDTLIRYLLNTDPSLFRYKIINDGQLSGIICIRYPWLRGPYVELLGIFAKFQNQGIGGKVINWLSQHTQQHAHNLWIIVSSFNETAQHLYRNHGFSAIANIPHLTGDHHDEILMRKRFFNE